MNIDRNTVSRSPRVAVTLVVNLVADWDEQEASRVERIALLQSRECDTLTPRKPLVGGYCINASRSGRAPKHRIG